MSNKALELFVVDLLRSSLTSHGIGEDRQSSGGEKHSFGVVLIVPAKEKLRVKKQRNSEDLRCSATEKQGKAG